MLNINIEEDTIRFYPISTFPSRLRPNSFLEPKYSQVNTIAIEDCRHFGLDIRSLFQADTKDSVLPIDAMDLSDKDKVMLALEDLPSCFVKDFDYGLGLTKAYRFIVSAVQDLSDCTAIVISSRRTTHVEEHDRTFYIASVDLVQATRVIDRTTRHSRTAAQSVNYASVRNFFAANIGKPPVPIRTGRSPLRRMLTEAAIRGHEYLSQDEQEAMLNIFAKNTQSLVTDKPKRLAALKSDIELVTLETLIERFQQMIDQETRERKWQDFLNMNSFILSLAFGYPIVKVRAQASVGGHTISGSGATIADYLVKNRLTNNCAIIEIKTPRTRLLNSRPYRGSVYSPSGHLVGAVNQALDQKNQFERQISMIKDNSRRYDIESFAVSCCLIIGTMPDDDAGKKSLELFRGNSKNVQIITFDELLLKLRNLRDLLKSPSVEPTSEPRSLETPF